MRWVNIHKKLQYVNKLHSFGATSAVSHFSWSISFGASGNLPRSVARTAGMQCTSGTTYHLNRCHDCSSFCRGSKYDPPKRVRRLPKFRALQANATDTFSAMQALWCWHHSRVSPQNGRPPKMYTYKIYTAYVYNII